MSIVCIMYCYITGSSPRVARVATRRVTRPTLTAQVVTLAVTQVPALAPPAVAAVAVRTRAPNLAVVLAKMRCPKSERRENSRTSPLYIPTVNIVESLLSFAPNGFTMLMANAHSVAYLCATFCISDIFILCSAACFNCCLRPKFHVFTHCKPNYNLYISCLTRFGFLYIGFYSI